MAGRVKQECHKLKELDCDRFVKQTLHNANTAQCNAHRNTQRHAAQRALATECSTPHRTATSQCNAPPRAPSPPSPRPRAAASPPHSSGRGGHPGQKRPGRTGIPACPCSGLAPAGLGASAGKVWGHAQWWCCPRGARGYQRGGRTGKTPLVLGSAAHILDHFQVFGILLGALGHLLVNADAAGVGLPRRQPLRRRQRDSGGGGGGRQRAGVGQRSWQGYASPPGAALVMCVHLPRIS